MGGSHPRARHAVGLRSRAVTKHTLALWPRYPPPTKTRTCWHVKPASLDHISKGRGPAERGDHQCRLRSNFGLDAHPDPALRYERPRVCGRGQGAWGRFDDADAFSRDKVQRRVDPAQAPARPGKHLKVQGPLNIERRPGATR